MKLCVLLKPAILNVEESLFMLGIQYWNFHSHYIDFTVMLVVFLSSLMIMSTHTEDLLVGLNM